MKRVTIEYAGANGELVVRSWQGNDIKAWTSPRGTVVVFIDREVVAEVFNCVGIFYSPVEEEKTKKRGSK
jgi:hypothetical protein